VDRHTAETKQFEILVKAGYPRLAFFLAFIRSRPVLSLVVAAGGLAGVNQLLSHAMLGG